MFPKEFLRNFTKKLTLRNYFSKILQKLETYVFKFLNSSQWLLSYIRRTLFIKACMKSFSDLFPLYLNIILSETHWIYEKKKFNCRRNIEKYGRVTSTFAYTPSAYITLYYLFVGNSHSLPI